MNEVLDGTDHGAGEVSPSLEITSLSKGYGEDDQRVEVLKDANFALYPGEAVGLIAPSGAGKSTLLHICGLLESPDAGEIYVGGKAVGLVTDYERTLIRRREIGFVYQFHHLLPEFSALENVILPQRINGLDMPIAEKRAQELLDYMKIGHRALHRPAEMSGGEKQRAAIARAVANAPRILLADEPTGNLDPETSSYVFDALLALVRGSGLSALIATHNHKLVERLDRAITVRNGRIEPILPQA